MAGRMGGVRVTQPGLVIHEIDVERNLLLVKGSVPGPKSGLVEIREVKLMAAPKAKLIGGNAAKDVSLEAEIFGAEVKPHLAARDGSRRAERAPRRHARSEDPRPRRRRPREAVAPEGHGPRPRRHHPRAAVHGRRCRLRAR